MTKIRLWELSQDIENLENRISDFQEDESLTDEEREKAIADVFTEWLKASGEFDEKAIATANYIRYLEALAEARKQESKRIKDLAEQAQGLGDKMRLYLASEMRKAGKTKIEGTTAKLSLRRKPARVCLNCEVEALPDEFKKVETKPRLNEIKRAIKNNPDFGWGFLSDNDEYALNIR